MTERIPLYYNSSANRPDEIPVGDSIPSSLAPWFVGKNRFINGALNFWQHRTSGRVGTGAGTIGPEAYFADRFSVSALGCTLDVTRGVVSGSTVLPDTTNYAMVLTVSGATGSSGAWFGQRIEGVRSLTGQVTVSFWGSGAAGSKVGVRAIQYFGAGGSAGVTTEAGVITLSTTPEKKSITFTLPSTNGKTVGANNYLYIVFDVCGTAYGGVLSGQNGAFAFSELQTETGPYATDFEYRPDAYEFVLCQRYFEVLPLVQLNGITFTTNGDTRAARPFKVRKRINPALGYSGTLNVIATGSGGYVINIDLGGLSLGANADILVVTGISNFSGISPAGTVVTWGDNGSGGCTAYANAEFS